MGTTDQDRCHEASALRWPHSLEVICRRESRAQASAVFGPDAAPFAVKWCSSLDQATSGAGVVVFVAAAAAELGDLEQLIQRAPVPILVLSLAPQAVSADTAMRLGASGYVTDKIDAEDLACAIRSVSRGNAFVCSPLEATDWTAEPASTTRPRIDASAELVRRLTNRERQVLEHLAGGKTIREIAEALGLSPKTIEAYRTRLTAKTGLRRRADLVRFACAAGIFDLRVA